jgi:VWFA-related protein
VESEDIRVFVEGREAQVTKVVGPEEPFHLGLVMDVSPSKEREVDPIREATDWFVSLFPEQDPIMLLTFDSKVYVDCDWTTDRKEVQEAIWEFGLHKPGSSTILYETVVMAVQQKFQEKKPRTAMILFSDGVDTGSKAVEKEESIEFLKRSGVLTYCVQHFSMLHHTRRTRKPMSQPPEIGPIPGSPGSQSGGIFIGGGNSDRDFEEYKARRMFQNAAAYLGTLARAGGGRYINIASVDELSKAYQRIYEDVAHVYTVSFIPPKPVTRDPFKKVRVKTSREEIICPVRPEAIWTER